jgi:superoxide reductase
MTGHIYSKEESMNRRNFIKGAIITTAALASKKAFADDYSQKAGSGLNRLKSKDTPTGLEKSHVPGIEAPGSVKAGEWFDIKVKVGYMKGHPSTPQHWITMIKVQIDGSEVAKSTFKTGGAVGPAMSYRVKLDRTATLEAIENCNLHGTWISEPVIIKVV